MVNGIKFTYGGLSDLIVIRSSPFRFSSQLRSAVITDLQPASVHIPVAMKVYSLSLLSVTPASPAQATLLGTSQDLSSFSFLQKGSVGEFMQFFTKVGQYDAVSRCF